MHKGVSARFTRLLRISAIFLLVLGLACTVYAGQTVHVNVGSSGGAIGYTDVNSGTTNPAVTQIIVGDTVDFDYLDTALAHSVTSVTDSSYTTFSCSPLNDPSSTCPTPSNSRLGLFTYAVSGLAAGNYYYMCDVHLSAMTGVIQVSAFGSATHYTVSNPGTVTAGSAFTITLTARDRNNNIVTNFNDSGATAFTLTSSDGGASFTPHGWSGGQESVTVTLTVAQTQSITATDGGVSGNSGSFTVNAAAANHYVLSGAPGSSNQGASFGLSVTTEDTFGNVSTSDSGDLLTLNSSDVDATKPGGTISGSNVFISGIVLRTTGSQTINVSGNLGTSGNVTIPVGATHFVVSAPSSANLGSNVNFTVTAEDTSNATVTGFADTVQITSSDVAATLPANSTLTNGVGNLSITFGTTGSQTIVATDTSTSSPTVTGQASVSITPSNCPDASDNNGDITRNSGPLTIPASGPASLYPSPITVSLPGQTVHNLQVTLYGFEHTFISNLDILLVGPKGQNIVLMSNAASGETGPGFNPIDLTFDDAASQAIAATISTPLGEGSYTPSAYALSARPSFNNSGSPAPPQSGYNLPAPAGSATLNSMFDGTDPNGPWYLYVQDNVAGDSGSILAGWSISINEHRFTNSDGPLVYNATPSATPYPSQVNVSGLTGNVATVTLRINGFTDNLCMGTMGFGLEGPGGEFFVPFSGVGDCSGTTETVNFIALRDSASTALPECCSGPLTQGAYLPSSYDQAVIGTLPVFGSPAPGAPYASTQLAQTDGTATFGSVFGGINPNGAWKLFVEDQYPFAPYTSESGSITSWSLRFTLLCRATTSSATSDFPTGATYPQQVTFTATVSCPSGTPTGSVSFFNGATLLGSATLNGSGQATLGPLPFNAGSYPISVSYAGDTVYSPSTSPVFTQVINKAATTSSITSITPATSSVFNQNVTINASVTSTGGIPGGSVTFSDNGVALPSGTVTLSGGTASYSISTLAVGSHSFTVHYNGGANFKISTSAASAYTVNKGQTSTTIGSSSLTTVYGQPVTFTATVVANAPSSGTPTGTVTFTDALTSQSITVALSSGTATLTCPSAACTDPTASTPIAAGAHKITVTYNGDGNFLTSTSAQITQTVNLANTKSVITTSLTPSTYGQAVTFTATVTANAPSAATPTGNVTFTDNGFFLGSSALSGGKATFTTSTNASALSGGTHTIGANYSGTTNFNPSSGSVTQNVNPAATSTTVASDSAVVGGKPTSTYGQNVNFTATITVPAGLASPTGSVNFVDGTTILTSVSISATSPPYTAVFQTSTLNAATHSITAQYVGDMNYGTSTSVAISQVVNKASTTTVVTSNNNPSTFGQSVKFTAFVTANAPSSATPTGTVAFFDGGTQIGSTQTLTASGSTATANVATTTLIAGIHSISVTYTPTANPANFTAAASNKVSQQVGQQATKITLTSSANPAFFRQSITFTAQVQGVSTGAPGSGTVTFMDGATTLCAAAPVNGTGIATCSVTPAAGVGSVGVHSVTAAFNGSQNFAPSANPVPMSPPQERAPAPRRIPQP